MNRALALLTRMLERVGSRAPLPEVLTDLVLCAERLAPETRCSIVLVDQATNTLRTVAGPNMGETFHTECDRRPIAEGFGTCAAAAARQAIVAADASTSHGFARCLSGTPAGVGGGGWSAPFYDEHGSLLGVFSIYRGNPRGPARLQTDLMRIGARLAGLIVVRHREAERLRASAHALLEVTERHRSRAAADLHEGVAQQLAGAALLLAGTARRLHPSDAVIASDITRISAMLGAAVGTVRDLAASIAPVAPGRIRLTTALKGLSARIQAASAITVHCTASPDLDARITGDEAVQLYRIAEEAVDNVLRHAAAGNLRIDLVANADAVELEIADDGAGVPEPVDGVARAGLTSMRTRAARIGATFAVLSREPRGTAVRVRIATGAGRTGVRPAARTTSAAPDSSENDVDSALGPSACRT
jgi:signal transduction histidine kinase